MLQPDMQQSQPSWPEDIHRMWREVKITHIPLSNEAITNVLEEFRRVYVNGGAEFACFALAAHPILDFYISRNTLDSIDFFAKFLAHPTVTEALPMLPVSKVKPYTLKPDWGSSFTFDGEIAGALVSGGAYKQFRGSGREAKRIGQEFCEALFGDRYLEIVMYQTSFIWSDWFYDVAWDHTWFGIDKGLKHLWVLAVTDTD